MAIIVTPRYPGEPVDDMLRRLKKAAQREGILHDIRVHSHFASPGERRRAKRARSLARTRS